MCGISIIINKKNQGVDEQLVRKSLKAIEHRGPDDQGIELFANIGLGHRRLSIIDLSSAGHQPMNYKHLVITYNGEVYNYIELRAELESLGHRFVSHTDTEVILAAYAEWGVNAFGRFNGMWAFIIYDKNKKELIACRDHFGIKPLYYASGSDYFMLCSEIKQFFTVPGFSPKLNEEIAFDFLAKGILNHTQNTFFEGITELKAGHFLRYDTRSHNVDVQCWYNIAIIPDNHAISYEEAAKEVYRLLSKSLKIRCRSDVNVGSCLSGGIDSSAMVMTLFDQQIEGFSLNTITSCYDNLKYDERRFSDLVNQQTSFNSIKVFPDLDDLLSMAVLDKIVYHQDQPVLSASHFSEYSVFKTARENDLIVMLDGQGSDEYFGGYGEFFSHKQYEHLLKFEFIRLINSLNERAKTRFGLYHEVRSFTDFVSKQWRNSSVRYNGKMKEYPGVNKNWYRNLESATKRPSLFRSVRELSEDELLSTSIPYQLHSEDRNSMMFSIESRLPYLDPDLVEFALSLPSEFKVRGSRMKSVLRDAVVSLPAEIKNRKDKMGFVAPDDLWFIENGNKIRTEIVDAVQTFPGIFDSNTIELYDQIVIKNRQYSPYFFRVLAFSKWMKIFNVAMV